MINYISSTQLYLYVLIIIFPLFASLTAGFLGRKLGASGVHFITTTCLILSSVLITIAFYHVGLKNNSIDLLLGTWVDCEFLLLRWELHFDQLSVTLGLAVVWCSTLIHVYSTDYLSSDPHNERFFSYLSAFTAGMLILIFGGNYFVMFVGWEMIGVVSYLLINFYFTRIQANKAAILAFTMNRAGDMLMNIGFFTIFNLFGSLSFSIAFSLAPLVNSTALTVIGALLFGGALAKSANIPFHSWLPGSMEAPTPVSALLHAATLVTAGVYLLLRNSPILEFTPTVLLVITVTGATTAIYGATSGLFQNDLKRIIAMSTISQLGYMFMAVGLSQYNVALFHTVNHSFFKCLLFLCAGAVLHSFNDEQDIRKMGGLIKFMPFIYSVMLIGTLSLMALPFLTGFYSKDLILELAYSKYSFSGMYAYILGSITAGVTAFYSFRLISLVFLQEANGQQQSYLNAHEANWAVIIPLFILSLFSIFFGYIMSDLFVGIGSDFFGNSLFILPEHTNIIEAELLAIPGSLPALYQDSTLIDFRYFLSPSLVDLSIKLLPTILSVLGAFLGLLMYNKKDFFKLLTELTKSEYSYSFYSKLTSSQSAYDLPAPQPLAYQREGEGEVVSHTPGTLPSQTLYAVTKNDSILKKIYSFFNGKYYFDIVYNNFIFSKGLHLSYKISKEIDRGIIEFVGPYGLSNTFTNTSKNLAKLDTGIITTYALYITISLLVFTFLFFASSTLNLANEGATIVSSTKGVNNLIFQDNAEIFKLIIITLFCLFILPYTLNNSPSRSAALLR